MRNTALALAIQRTKGQINGLQVQDNPICDSTGELTSGSRLLVISRIILYKRASGKLKMMTDEGYDVNHPEHYMQTYLRLSKMSTSELLKELMEFCIFRHIYDGQRQLVATVCAISPFELGFSVVNPLDRCNRYEYHSITVPDPDDQPEMLTIEYNEEIYQVPDPDHKPKMIKVLKKVKVNPLVTGSSKKEGRLRAFINAAHQQSVGIPDNHWIYVEDLKQSEAFNYLPVSSVIFETLRMAKDAAFKYFKQFSELQNDSYDELLALFRVPKHHNVEKYGEWELTVDCPKVKAYVGSKF